MLNKIVASPGGLRSLAALLLGLTFMVMLQIMSFITGSDLPNRPPLLKSLFADPEYNAVLGDPNGDVTLVEFFDYNDDHARDMRSIIKLATLNDKKLRVVFREYNVLNGTSTIAALAALAAHKQGKYLRMHDVLLSKESGELTMQNILNAAENLEINTAKLVKDMDNSDLLNFIATTKKNAHELNLEVSPAFILGNTGLSKDLNNKYYRVYTQLGEITLDDLLYQIKLIREMAQNG